MANDLESSIVVKADVTGVESGMQRAKRSVEDLGNAAEQAGRKTDLGLNGVGKGGDAAARNLERATRSIEQQIQRQIVAMQSGSKESASYWEAIANQRGVNTNALRPLLDQLEAVRAKTEEAKTSAQGMEKVWESVGRVAGGAAATIAAAFSYRKFITETIQAEQEQAQLAAVLKSTGEAAGFSRDQLNEMAEAMSKRSIFGAGDINQAQTRLLSYTNIVGTQFPRAMQNVIDMAARMGMDVKSSAETIGRALDIPSEGLTALQRQGFRFTEEQKKLVEQLEKTGRAGEAQAIILNALESSYGGAAQAARDTFGGSLIALQETINDLMTGDSRGMNAMRAGVESLVAVLGDPKTREAFQTFVGWVAETSAWLVKLASAYVAWRQASNKEEILAGVDEFGQLSKNAEAATARVQRLTEQAERYQEAISRGSNVEFNETRLEKTRDLLAQARQEAEGAASALKRFANANDTGKQLTAADLGLSLPSLPSRPMPRVSGDDDKKAENAYKTLIDSIKEKIALQQAELESNEKLTEADRLRVKILQELSGARQKTALGLVEELAVGEKLNKAKATEAKETADAVKSYADLVDARQNSIVSIQQQIQREKDVAAAMGLSKRQVAELEIAKLEEMATDKERRASVMDSIKAESEVAKLYRDEAKALRDLAAAKRGTVDKQQAADVAKEAGDAAKKASEEWTRYTDDINRSLTDALLRGFESGKGFAENLRDTMKNMFGTLVLRPVISAVMTPVAGAVSSLVSGSTSTAGGGGQSSGNSLLSMGSNLASAAGLFGAGGLTGALTAGAGWMTGATTFGGAMTAAGSLIGTGTLGGFMSGIGMAAGALGPIALAVVAILALLGDMSGEKRFGGQYGYSAESNQVYNARRDTFVNADAGRVTFLEGPSGGEFGRSEVTKAIGSTVEGINTVLKAVGSGMAVASFQAGIETSEKGRGGVFAGGSFGNGITFGESGRADASGSPFETTSSRSLNAEEAVKAFSLDLKQVTIQALQAASDIPKSIASKLEGVVAEKLTDEAADQLLSTINAQIQAVTSFRQVVEQMPISNLRDLAFDSVSAIIDAFGGIDAASQGFGGFFQNYFSETERTAALTESVSKAMSALGFEMPSLEQSAEAARAQFRALVEGIDASTAEGAKQIAGLLSLEGAFAQLTPAIEATAGAVRRSAADIASEKDNLERQILQLQGNTAELRARDLAKLDESNRALQQQYWALLDAQAAAAKATAQETSRSVNVADLALQQMNGSATEAMNAWKSVGDSIVDEINRIKGVAAGDGSIGLAAAQGRFAIASAQARAGDLDAAQSLPELSRKVLELAEKTSRSALDYQVLQSQIAASLLETAKSAGKRGGFSVPAFAGGGNHSGGWAMVGEMGPELAYLPPARIYTAGQSAGMLDQGALLAELRLLREEVEGLRGLAGSTDRNIDRMAQTSESWSRTGVPVTNQPNTKLATA